MSDTCQRGLANDFADLWLDRTTVPDVWSFLRDHPFAVRSEVVEVLLADQWRRHELGCPRPVEEYLSEPTIAANHEWKLDLVYGEYRAASRFGTPPDLTALAARFPDLADSLRRHVEVEALLTPSGAAPLERTGWFLQAEESPEAKSVPLGIAPPGYEYIRELGRGGFGTVWLAKHLALDKLVAVKHLRQEWVSGHSDQLGREARTMAALKVHANRVTVFDLIDAESGWFLVMDFVAGGSLGQLIVSDGPVDWIRASRYLADVADGLTEVHALGIWHRDIKPDNILLDHERDVAVLTDFGLAAHDADAAGCCGTPGYMAPELVDGLASGKSDVFALAATLFHLVIGRKPFESRNPLTARKEALAGLPDEVLAQLPLALSDVVRAGLQSDPSQRPNLAEFTARLRSCHTVGLSERLRMLSGDRPRSVGLHVIVSTASEKDLIFRTVFHGPLTDQSPAVRCDEIVRIEAEADADGYLTILNLGSSGEVNVLFPNPRVPDNRVRSGRPQRLTVKLTPPAGTDHAVLVWTPRPCPLTAREWRERIEAGRLVMPLSVDRGMEFVMLDTPEPAGSDWVAAIVGIEHGS